MKFTYTETMKVGLLKEKLDEKVFGIRLCVGECKFGKDYSRSYLLNVMGAVALIIL